MSTLRPAPLDDSSEGGSPRKALGRTYVLIECTDQACAAVALSLTSDAAFGLLSSIPQGTVQGTAWRECRERKHFT
jgi:hypothetical protein